jgi:hypothetical protein
MFDLNERLIDLAKEPIKRPKRSWSFGAEYMTLPETIPTQSRKSPIEKSRNVRLSSVTFGRSSSQVANNESLKSTTRASAGFCVDSQATMERPHGLPATVTGRTARASVAAKRLIPIRFRACRADAERMANHVRKFYDQIEVMAYKIAAGNDVIISRAES